MNEVGATIGERALGAREHAPRPGGRVSADAGLRRDQRPLGNRLLRRAPAPRGASDLRRLGRGGAGRRRGAQARGAGAFVS